ncbi:hypothetical protein SELMODRAFT_404604 [Selaginella moellendorffii]|uniref:Uncharacterized protein n=1 Tax=Selaginella moellendorffii TaxID=88036 RepID=D8QVU9_SELML|nr:hypothetical protein SELMODRAFT_404604 [Selaginella moellendorffii]
MEEAGSFTTQQPNSQWPQTIIISNTPLPYVLQARDYQHAEFHVCEVSPAWEGHHYRSQYGEEDLRHQRLHSESAVCRPRNSSDGTSGQPNTKNTLPQPLGMVTNSSTTPSVKSLLHRESGHPESVKHEWPSHYPRSSPSRCTVGVVCRPLPQSAHARGTISQKFLHHLSTNHQHQLFSAISAGSSLAPPALPTTKEHTTACDEGKASEDVGLEEMGSSTGTLHNTSIALMIS